MNILKHRKLTVFTLLILLILFSVGYYFVELGDSEDWENKSVNNDINRLLQIKNTEEINTVAANKETRIFLLHLNKGEKAKHTSGFGGLTPDNLHYYGTEIKNRKIDLFVKPLKKKNIVDHIFPKFKIVKVRLLNNQ